MSGYYDIHTHIIPHFDDGSKSFEMTEEMLKKEYADGVRTIYATSHYRVGMFETGMDRYTENFEKVKEIARQIGQEGINILIGCEFHANMDMIEIREGFYQGKVLCALIAWLSADHRPY